MAPQLIATNGRWRRGLGVVDRPGDELLAGAGLAQDQHARVVGRDLTNQARHVAHGHRCARRHVLIVARFLDHGLDRNAQGGGKLLLT